MGIACAALAATCLATLTHGTPVSAYGDAVAYSRFDGAQYRLVVMRRGVTSDVPIAPRPEPFDADLGPGPSGRLAAAYSRCDDYDRPGGCRLYLYDFGTGKEQAIAGTHRAGASESQPAIWRKNVAFIRDRTLWGRFGGGTVRLDGGPSTICRSGRCARGRQGRPSELDLRGRLVAFSWWVQDFTETGATEVRLVAPGGRSRLVEHRGGGGLSLPLVGWPTLEGHSLFYARTCLGEPGCGGRKPFAIRYDVRARSRKATPLLDRVTLWYAHGAGRDYELIGPSPSDGCDVDGEVCRLMSAPSALG